MLAPTRELAQQTQKVIYSEIAVFPMLLALLVQLCRPQSPNSNRLPTSMVPPRASRTPVFLAVHQRVRRPATWSTVWRLWWPPPAAFSISWTPARPIFAGARIWYAMRSLILKFTLSQVHRTGHTRLKSYLISGAGRG